MNKIQKFHVTLSAENAIYKRLRGFKIQNFPGAAVRLWGAYSAPPEPPAAQRTRFASSTSHFARCR